MVGIASQDAECPFLAQLAEYESMFTFLCLISMVDGKCQLFSLSVWDIIARNCSQGEGGLFGGCQLTDTDRLFLFDGCVREN